MLEGLKISVRISTLVWSSPGESAPGTNWIGGWVDPRVGVDDVERRKFVTTAGLDCGVTKKTY
jgi:hypothetical protein